MKKISLAIEGTDGSGKNTQLTTILELLKTAKNSTVIVTNFPQYSFPTGYCIRHMNRGLAEKWCRINRSSIEEEIRIRAALYALDRIFAWICMESIINEKKHEQIIHISDRLYISQINTISYVLTRKNASDTDKVKKKMETLIPHILQSDYELINYLKPYSCILQPQQQNHSLKRQKLDRLENTIAQKLSLEGFNFITTKPQYQSFSVYSQNHLGQWRDKFEVAKEILSKSCITLEKPKNKVQNLSETYIIGPRYFLETWCKNWHNPHLEESLKLWEKISFLNNETVEKQFNKNKKEWLDKIESNIVLAINNEIMQNDLQTININKNVLEQIVHSIKRLSTSFTNGKLLGYIDFLCNELAIPNSINRIIQHLYNQNSH